jgi:hypothetical protein
MSAIPGAPSKTVRLAADGRGEPVDVSDYHAGIVEHCADMLAMLARHRAVLPLASLAETERRIQRLREAIRALPGDAVGAARAWWERAADGDDPWKAWAAVFVLGSVEAPASTDGIRLVLERIPDDDEERWETAADALALVELPDVAAFGDELLSSPCAASRAVGLDLLSRRGALSVDRVRPHLGSPQPQVVASAARVAWRTGTVEALTSELTGCLASSSSAAAWEAARALTLAGMRGPYLEIQGGGPLAAALGARAVELLVMAGQEDDIGTLEALIAGSAMTPALLSAVARFGDVSAWSFLLHHLAEPELAGVAVQALRTLFGDLVPEADAMSFAAWKSAIAGAGFNRALRYRAGRPWRPSTVLEECATGTLSRVEVDRRIDEIAARTGAAPSVDLGRWETDLHQALATFAEDVKRREARSRPGAWRS